MHRKCPRHLTAPVPIPQLPLLVAVTSEARALAAALADFAFAKKVGNGVPVPADFHGELVVESFVPVHVFISPRTA